MMPFGISFDGFSPVSEAIELARHAEAAGAQSFWIAEHLGFRETFVTATALGLATRRARLVPTSISPYLRHPMPTAMSLATLDELLPGRAAVAIGVGNPMFLRESGLAVDKPVRAVREYVQALRALADGVPVEQSAHTFALNGARLAFGGPGRTPIHLAPMGPQMLRLSGQIADGVVLSAGLSLPFVEQSLTLARAGCEAAGRDPTKLHRSAYVYFMGGGDERDQRAKIRQKLAFLFRNESLAGNITASGLPIDHAAIMAAVARRDMDEAVRLVPDEAADVFSIVGTAQQCRNRIEQYLAAGLDEIVLSLSGQAADRLRSLDVMRALPD